MIKNKFVLFVIGFIVLSVALPLFPALRLMVGQVNTTGWSTLMKAVVAGFPYALLFFAGLAIYNQSK